MGHTAKTKFKQKERKLGWVLAVGSMRWCRRKKDRRGSRNKCDQNVLNTQEIIKEKINQNIYSKVRNRVIPAVSNT